MRARDSHRRVTRRVAAKLGLGTGVAALLAACAPLSAPPTPAPKAAPTIAPSQPAATAKPVEPQSGTTSATPAPKPAAPTAQPAAAQPKVAAKPGGTFTFAHPVDNLAWNPLNQHPGHYPWIRAVFNALIQYDDKLDPRPELAESWEFNADGTQLRMKLRQGVQFHSGREFVAQDFVNTLEIALDPKTAANVRSLAESIKKVEAPEKYGLVLSFDKPNPGIFDALDWLMIVDKDTWPENNQKANATGPFKVDWWKPNEGQHLVKHDTYWESGRPALDDVDLRVIPDSQSLVTFIETGQVDAIWRPPLREYVRLKEKPDLQAYDGAEGAVYFNIQMRVDRPPFDNKKVRQAVNYAIDRKRFVETALLNVVKPTVLAFPPHSWAYSQDLESAYPFDLDKSRSLLNEAGVANVEVPLLTSFQRNPEFSELAQILQSDLAKVGIKVTIDNVEPTIYNGRWMKGDFAIATHTYGRSHKDPGTLFGAAIAFFAKNAPAGYESAEYSRLIEEGASTLEREKRVPIYRKLQELLLDECAVCPIAFELRTFVTKKSVKDFTYSLDNMPYLGKVWLDR
jgi:peptide/nickel transport system substrate-binding protein